jgi:peptide/nickel transport system substrate-binding protein
VAPRAGLHWHPDTWRSPWIEKLVDNPALVVVVVAGNLALATSSTPHSQLPLATERIATHENRTVAGVLHNGVLELCLEACSGRWYPVAEDGPRVEVQAFGEAGGPLQIPAPPVRVREGTFAMTEELHMKSMILCCTLLLLGACGGAGSQAEIDPETIPESERYGGTAVVAITADPQSLNPLLMATDQTGTLQAAFLSLRLVDYNDALEIVPLLAERWDTVRVAPDTLQLTFHLRRDVRWHDGVPTTAEDVRFTYERMRDPKVAFAFTEPLALWSPLVEVVDSFTVRFRLRAHAEFLDYWTGNVIVPAHLLGDVPPEQLRNHPFWTRPIGNGPFRFVRYLPNQELVFEANPDFPEALGGRPYLDRVVVRVVPDDNTRLVELLRGTLDVAPLRAAQTRQAAASPGVRLSVTQRKAYGLILWNTRLPLFDDARVRRALGMALDREALVQAFLAGHGEVGRFTATPWHWQFDASDPETLLPHDLEAAGRLLDEAGWRLRDGSGVRTDEHGNALRFTLKAPHANQTYTDVLPAVQAQLRRVGADVRAQFVELYTLWDQLDGQVGPDGERQREFEAALVEWGEWGRLDNTYILHSRSRNGMQAAASYANPRADWFIDTLAVTVDRDAARPLWQEYQRFMVQESPLTVLFYPRAITAMRTRLQDVESRPQFGAFGSAQRWWIAPGERSTR